MQPTQDNSARGLSSEAGQGPNKAEDSEAVVLAEAVLACDLKADFDDDIEAMFNADDPQHSSAPQNRPWRLRESRL
jgi:hypothetical protein